MGYQVQVEFVSGAMENVEKLSIVNFLIPPSTHFQHTQSSK